MTEADIIALLFTGAARLHDAENGAVADAEKRRLDEIRDREMARHTDQGCRAGKQLLVT